MFFKNLQLYRLPQNWPMTADQLAAALESQQFVAAGKSDMLSQGWAAPRPNGGLVHSVNRQFLIRLQGEKKLLPSTVINQFTKARAAELEEAQGFAPGKKAMKELKEQITDELLPKAFGIESNTFAWIDPVSGWLVVDAASPAKADEVIKLLLKSVDKLPLESLRVQRSPVGAMTEWLQADVSPAGFTVDQDAIMRATGESKAQVAYKRHTLEADDIRRHIAAGKQCTRLAMTWSDKISFVLDESLAIKSVKPLEIIKESATRNDDERFDSDFTLMTGELAKMLADLVEALGGEAVVDLVAVGAAMARPAAGHEPVREQRVVLELNGQTPGTVPPGDGSSIDPLHDQAVEVVRTHRRASVSLVQSHLRVGFNRAGNLLEAMEALGVVSGMASNGNRTVLAGPGATA